MPDTDSSDPLLQGAYGTFGQRHLVRQQSRMLSSHGECPPWGWDYILVFATSDADGVEDDEERVELVRRANVTRSRVLRRLRDSGFAYAQMHIPAEDQLFVCCALPESELMEKAEQTGMKLELKPHFGGGFLDFTRARANCFVNHKYAAEGKPYFLPSDRVILVLAKLRRVGIDIQRLVYEERMIQGFALHSEPERVSIEKQAVYDRWWYPFHGPPLTEMKNYAGARIALYFAFASFYARLLFGMALLSITVAIVLRYTNSEAVVAWVRFIFGIALIVWSTYFIEFWQRRRSILVVKWGLNDFFEDTENDIRPEFNGVERPGFYSKGGFVALDDLAIVTPGSNIVDPSSRTARLVSAGESDLSNGNSESKGEHLLAAGDDDWDSDLHSVVTGLQLDDLPRFPYSSKRELRNKIFCSAMVTFFFAACIGVATFFILFHRVEIIKAFGGGSFGTYMPGIITAIIIYAADFFWTSISTSLTRWENHRTSDAYQESIVYKRFAFQFVSNYISLFYIAFVKPYRVSDPCVVGADGVTPDCMGELKTWLISLVVTKCTVSQLLEVCWPLATMYINNWQQRKLERLLREEIAVAGSTIEEVPRDEVAERYVGESNLSSYASPIYDYGELVIQYGYLAMFGLPFPLATAINYLNNTIEWRIDAFKIFNLSQRPDASNVADIGAWLPILKLLSMLAVVTNAGIIVFTADALHYMLPVVQWNPAIEFLFFEHLLVCVRWIISYIVNETPGKTHRLLARQDFLTARLFNEGWKPHYRNTEDSDSEENATRASAECVPYKSA